MDLLDNYSYTIQFKRNKVDSIIIETDVSIKLVEKNCSTTLYEHDYTWNDLIEHLDIHIKHKMSFVKVVRVINLK
jgi:hypothetical protein